MSDAQHSYALMLACLLAGYALGMLSMRQTRPRVHCAPVAGGEVCRLSWEGQEYVSPRLRRGGVAAGE